MPAIRRAFIEGEMDKLFKAQGIEMRTSDLMQLMEDAGLAELKRLGL